MGKVIKAYKGFNSDMTCRDFQYEEGKEYETEKAEVCETGFHACEYPLDTFRFYDPNRSVYHEVEVSGDIDTDDVKVCGTKIKIGARLDIAGLVKAAIDFTMNRIVSTASKDEPHGASSATGSCGASSATGFRGASSADHPEAVAVAWGYQAKAKGVKGAHLVFADWEGDEDYHWKPEKWTLKGAKMVQVDGEVIKENTWYTMKDGEIIESK